MAPILYLNLYNFNFKNTVSECGLRRQSLPFTPRIYNRNGGKKWSKFHPGIRGWTVHACNRRSALVHHHLKHWITSFLRPTRRRVTLRINRKPGGCPARPIQRWCSNRQRQIRSRCDKAVRRTINSLGSDETTGHPCIQILPNLLQPLNVLLRCIE